MTDIFSELADFSARGLRSRQRLAKASEARAGCSPRDAMLSVGKMTLYRYRSQSDAADRPALLIVYALVNRPDMADLEPGRSLIEGLLQAGLDVWLVDWGYPDGADRALGNIFENQIGDIVRSERYRRSFDRNESRTKGVCLSCPFDGACDRYPVLAERHSHDGVSDCAVARPMLERMSGYLNREGFDADALRAWL